MHRRPPCAPLEQSTTLRPRRTARPSRPLTIGCAGLIGLLMTTGACTSGAAQSGPTSPSSAPPTTSTSTAVDTTDPTGPSETGESTSSAEAGTPSTGSVPLPTEFLTVERSVRDPDLGHQITVTKIARNMAWPPGYRGQELAFELVGVEMRWTPGVAYTAALRAADFTIVTTSTFPNRPDRLLEPTLLAAGWSVLPASVPAGQSATGWMVFKVDPKGAPALRLDYTRPAIRVTNAGGVTFPKQAFVIQLVAPPTAASPGGPTAPLPGASPAPTTRRQP